MASAHTRGSDRDGKFGGSDGTRTFNLLIKSQRKFKMGFQPRHFQITIYKEPFRPEGLLAGVERARIGVYRLSTWHVVAQVHNAYGTKQNH